MSIQWMLAARIDDGRPVLTIDAVRSLSAPELSSLDEAERVFVSLTSASPYQAAADAYAAAIAAFGGLQGQTTESGAARQERAWRALELAIGAITAAPAEMSRLASDVMGAEVGAVASAAEQLRAGAEWQSLQGIGPAQFEWVNAPAGPEVLLVSSAGSRLRIQAVLGAVMQGLAVIMAEVLVAAADKIMAASRVVRGLEAEVLLGRAGLVALPEGQAGDFSGQVGLQLRDLPVGLMATALGGLRRSRAMLAARDGTAQPPVAQDNVGGSVPDDGAPADESPAAAGETEPSSGAAAAPDQAASTAELVRPPVDLYRVAQHLAETLTAVENAYGELPSIDEMFRAADRDGGTYGSLLRQVAMAVQRTEESLAAAGIQPVRVNLPPTGDDIAALRLDDLSPQMRLRQQLIAELLVVEGAVGQLQSLRNPAELRVGPGGVVISARFDPVAPSRVRGWMLQAARMAEHSAEIAALVTGADARPDGSAEDNWLARAAGICVDHGLHEAALLYLAALATAPVSSSKEAEEAPDPVPKELIEETLRRFAAGDTCNASAVAISLVRAMVPLIARQAGGNPTATAVPDPASESGQSDSPAGAQ